MADMHNVNIIVKTYEIEAIITGNKASEQGINR